MKNRMKNGTTEHTKNTEKETSGKNRKSIAERQKPIDIVEEIENYNGPYNKASKLLERARAEIVDLRKVVDGILFETTKHTEDTKRGSKKCSWLTSDSFEKRTVKRGPQIFLHGVAYASEKLWPYLGKDVFIEKSHPQNKIKVFSERGDYIGECKPISIKMTKSDLALFIKRDYMLAEKEKNRLREIEKNSQRSHRRKCQKKSPARFQHAYGQTDL